MTQTNDQIKAGIDFKGLNELLTKGIAPFDLAIILEELGHNYSLLLIENPDRIPAKDASNQVYYLRELRLLIQNMGIKKQEKENMAA